MYTCTCIYEFCKLCGYGITMEEATGEEGPMAPYCKVNTVLLFLLSLHKITNSDEVVK